MKNKKTKKKKLKTFAPKNPNGVNFAVENLWVANEKWEAPRQETTFIKNIPFSGISGLYHAIFLVPFFGTSTTREEGMELSSKFCERQKYTQNK